MKRHEQLGLNTPHCHHWRRDYEDNNPRVVITAAISTFHQWIENVGAPLLQHDPGHIWEYAPTIGKGVRQQLSENNKLVVQLHSPESKKPKLSVRFLFNKRVSEQPPF